MNNAVVLDLNLTYKGTIFTIKDNIYFSLYEMWRTLNYIHFETSNIWEAYITGNKNIPIQTISIFLIYDFLGENQRMKKIYTLHFVWYLISMCTWKFSTFFSVSQIFLTL